MQARYRINRRRKRKSSSRFSRTIIYQTRGGFMCHLSQLERFSRLSEQGNLLDRAAYPPGKNAVFLQSMLKAASTRPQSPLYSQRLGIARGIPGGYRLVVTYKSTPIAMSSPGSYWFSIRVNQARTFDSWSSWKWSKNSPGWKRCPSNHTR